ncbi:MAG TPA: FmdB family transcriptional regulator [Oceanithermus profundus]|uniref:FmdB family transcriptional regulator n=1 Tax=Oceanithermus profundus TaxID=187137 RepID=A0A7C4ZET7_9DEIN|nr:FmdB family transcriptional regulator [Oceanithermus profundus]
MPTYVYKGLESGEYFEVEQSIHDDPLTHHPQTGEPVKRVIQPVGVIFKGSGWYVKDSRSKGSTGPEGSKGKKDQAGSDAAKSAAAD